MGVLTPPNLAIQAMESGTAQVTRRLEIYETDGTTRWNFDEPDSRFIEGGVTLDYGRDERRALDVTLRNNDGALRPNPYGGFWYDKVIKPFRGIRYRNRGLQPKIVIVEEQAANSAYALRSVLMQVGFRNVDVNLAATKLEDVSDYDIIVSNRSTSSTQKAAFLSTAFTVGRKIITIGVGNGSAHLPFVETSSNTSGSINYSINPVTNRDIPIPPDWATESSTSASTGVRITVLKSNATAVATSVDGATTFFTGVLAQNSNGGRWFQFGSSNFSGTQAKKLIKNSTHWLMGESDYATWECQLGEFVIDNISDQNFPFTVKITGRDYTKRPLNSKIRKSTSWEEGTSGRTVIEAVAANAGILKMNLPPANMPLPTRLDYAPGTSRWQIMKEIANSFSYDIYFDSQGYLTMDEYQDPVSSPVIASFQTGRESGNIASYSRSVSDSELYNVIVITSESSSDTLPFYGEAQNTEPSSPTSVKKIGERVKFWLSAALASDEACAQLAQSWLKIYALESYDLNVDTVCYPWLDVGWIVNFLESDRLDNDVTSFLLSSLSIPLTLGPMSGQMRRLTIVTDTGLVEPEYLTDSPESNPDPNPEDPQEPDDPGAGSMFPSTTLYPATDLYPGTD